MTVSEDLLSRLVKLALKQAHSDAGILLLYRQNVFWLVYMTSPEIEAAGLDQTYLNLALSCPVSPGNAPGSTVLPLSVLSEVAVQGIALDWPSIAQQSEPLGWSTPLSDRSSGVPPHFPDSTPVISFEDDLHLRWMKGRSLCCLPLWTQDYQLSGILYMEGKERDVTLDLFRQESLKLLAEQLELATSQTETPQTPQKNLPLELPIAPQDIFQILIQHTPGSIALFDRQMHYLAVSDRWRQDYQLGDQPLLGRSHYEVFPEITDRWKALHQRCLAGEVLTCDEDSFVRINGSVDWVRWELHPWYTKEESPQVGGVIMFTEVITERKRNEAKIEALNQSLQSIVREQTATLLQTNRELGLEVDFNQRVTALAKRFLEVSFDAVDEEIHFALEELGRFTQADQAFLFQFSENVQCFSMTHEWCLKLEHRQLKQLQQIHRSKFPWATIHLLRGHSLCITDILDLPETASIDRLHWQRHGLRSLLCVPLRAKGQTLGWIGLANFQDPQPWSEHLRLVQSIGEIISYALQQQKSEVRLRDQTEQLRLALEATYMGVWEAALTQTPEGDPLISLQWSPQMEKLFGFEPYTFDGELSSFWERVHPQDRAFLQAHEQQTFHRGEGCVEYRIILPNTPSLRWIRRRYRVFYDAEGEPTRLLGIDEDITERKNIQEERDRFFALSNDLLAIANMDGYFQQVNPAFERVLGYSRTELETQPFLEFVHPDDRAATLQVSSQLAQGTAVQQFENRYRCKDGSYRWLNWSATPLLEDGITYAVARDVTEQKAAVAALEARESLFRTISSNLPGVIYRYELYPDGTDAVTYANAGSLRIWEWPPEAIVADCQLCWQQVHPDDFPSMWASVLESARTLTQWNWEWRLLNPSGRQIWVQGQASPKANPDGTIVWDGIILDISDRKRMEAALWESETRYRRMIETTVEGIWFIDEQHRTTFVSPQMAIMLGYTPEEMIGNNWFHFMDEASQAFAKQHFQDHHQPVERHDLKFKRKDGSDLWAIVSSHPILDTEGASTGTLRMLTDITERKKAEEALRQSEANLKTIVNTTTYGILILDQGGKIKFINQAAMSFFGRREDDLVGSDFGIPLLEKTNSVEVEIPDFYGGFRTMDIRVAEIFWEQLPALFVSLHDITDRKKVEADLRYQASHDTLTRLPNRLFLMDRLDHALSCQDIYPNYYFALLFIDLDRFKIINDSLGHLVGDRLLIEVAKRLRNLVGAFDTVVRLSGDEFVVLLDNINNFDQAIAMAQLLKKNFHRPFVVDEYSIVTTVSIGIALSSKDYANSLEVLRDADNAMYRAKSQGKDRYEIFDQKMHTEALRSLQLENDLRGAVERQEFRVYYQPIICLKTYHLVGFEALVRWFHPQQGLIAPDEFIPLAEETGIIEPMGEWIFGEVCQQMMHWEPLIRDFDQFTLSTNLSTRQLQLSDLCENIDRIIQRHQVDTRYLKFELTETVLIDNLDQTTIVLEHFRRKRIGICIDDFGTGYSSLTYLHKLPIDTLKIDKSFVKEMKGDIEGRFQINEAIITLAHALGMNVVAEGIETITQMETLQNLHCEFGQGYLFSPPVPADVATRFVQHPYLYPEGVCG